MQRPCLRPVLYGFDGRLPRAIGASIVDKDRLVRVLERVTDRAKLSEHWGDILFLVKERHDN